MNPLDVFDSGPAIAVRADSVGTVYLLGEAGANPGSGLVRFPLGAAADFASLILNLCDHDQASSALTAARTAPLNRRYLERSRISLIWTVESPDQSFGPKNLDPHSTTIQTAIKTPNGMINSMSTSP